jgi:hypothetical protein
VRWSHWIDWTAQATANIHKWKHENGCEMIRFCIYELVWVKKPYFVIYSEEPSTWIRFLNHRAIYFVFLCNSKDHRWKKKSAKNALGWSKW